MNSDYRQIKQQLPLNKLTLDVLFALRLWFDDRDDIVDIDMDIAELDTFPERLFDSYRPEWEAYVARALANYVRQSADFSTTAFLARILDDVDDMKNNNQRYQRLIKAISRAKTVINAPNTQVFPTPWRQQITALLLPLSADPPKS